jgi:hypothetical protein
MGVKKDGLGIRIRNDPQAFPASEPWKFVLEFGAEIRTFNVMNAASESFACTVENHTGPFGAKVGIVVRPEKYV